MTFLSGLTLFIAAMLGGALNSVAGGGSFITLPTLIFTGVPSKIANATSTVALWPGSVASVSAYRRELVKQNRVLLVVLGITSLVGGILGALLLLGTSQGTFVQLLPYLLLIATVLFAVSGPITSRLRARASARASGFSIDASDSERPLSPDANAPQAPLSIPTPPIDTLRDREEPDAKEKARVSWRTLSIISLVQLVIATYGGYFGGGIGILILATLGFMGMENVHEMNAVKTVLQSSINGVAVITFIIAGVVVWPQTIVMILGAMVGGFAGASFARQLDPRVVRGFVILVGTAMTIYFFVYR